MVYGLKPLNRSMVISKNLFLKIFFLISIFCQNIIGQDLFQLNTEHSSVLQNIITSDIGIADLNNDGTNDIILYGYNKIGNREGLFLNTYSISTSGSIDTLQMGLLDNYFTYIPENHSSRYIGGDGKLALGDYDLDGKIDVLAHGAEFMFLTKNLGDNLSSNNYLPIEFIENIG